MSPRSEDARKDGAGELRALRGRMKRDNEERYFR